MSSLCFKFIKAELKWCFEMDKKTVFTYFID